MLKASAKEVAKELVEQTANEAGKEIAGEGAKLFANTASKGAGGFDDVEKVLSGAESNGIEVWSGMDDFLGKEGANAAYFPEKGTKGVQMVGEKTEYGDVMHELRHYDFDS